MSSLTLVSNSGKIIPLTQLGEIKTVDEDPFLRRRDRTPTISVRCDIQEGLQPPQVSNEILKEIQPLIEKLPEGYKIEVGGNIEDSEKANKALLPMFPIMIILTLFVIVVQVRSLSMMTMVFLKSTLRPRLSVRRPSSSTCSNRLNTSGCAFSISSSNTTEYGLRRTFSVS